MSADQGDRTIGTAVVAPLADLQIRAVFRRRQKAFAPEGRGLLVFKGDIFFPAFHRAKGVDDVRKTADAEKRVHLGQLFHHFFAIPFHKATGCYDMFTFSVFFQPCDVENIVNGLFLCTLDKAAGVDHNDLRLALVRCDLIPRVMQRTEHHLGVDKVLGAAEGDKADFCHKIPIVPFGYFRNFLNFSLYLKKYRRTTTVISQSYAKSVMLASRYKRRFR